MTEILLYRQDELASIDKNYICAKGQLICINISNAPLDTMTDKLFTKQTLNPVYAGQISTVWVTHAFTAILRSQYPRFSYSRQYIAQLRHNPDCL